MRGSVDSDKFLKLPPSRVDRGLNSTILMGKAPIDETRLMTIRRQLAVVAIDFQGLQSLEHHSSHLKMTASLHRFRFTVGCSSISIASTVLSMADGTDAIVRICISPAGRTVACDRTVRLYSIAVAKGMAMPKLLTKPSFPRVVPPLTGSINSSFGNEGKPSG